MIDGLLTNFISNIATGFVPPPIGSHFHAFTNPLKQLRAAQGD